MMLEAAADKIFILQATPRPGRCGVTDNSLLLQEALRHQNVACEIVCLSKTDEIPAGFHRVGREEELAKFRGTLVVQVSLYGYQRRGVPFALLRGLRSFVSQPGNRLIAYFHETWANASSPLKSAFWLGRLQRQICHRILRLSNMALFSTPVTYSWGRAAAGVTDVVYCPTFSNVGEPDDIVPWASRSRALIVFGSLRTRPHCYASPEALSGFMSRAGIDEIIDIGPPMDEATRKRIEGLPIRSLGMLPAADVSRHLQSTRFGVFSTPWGFASKSGVLAALQAHGVVPVSTRASPDAAYQGEPGPVIDRDFLRLGEVLLPSEPQLMALSSRIHARYQRHSLSAAASRIAGFARDAGRAA